MCWRPICTNGVHCGIGFVVAKVRCGAERISRIGGIGHWGNNAHKEWNVVQIEEAISIKEIHVLIKLVWCIMHVLITGVTNYGTLKKYPQRE